MTIECFSFNTVVTTKGSFQEKEIDNTQSWPLIRAANFFCIYFRNPATYRNKIQAPTSRQDNPEKSWYGSFRKPHAVIYIKMVKLTEIQEDQTLQNLAT